jgi:hypothetical protein
VIKEIPVMTAVPAETGSRLTARALALALVQVLALGLPDPDHITIWPCVAGNPYVSLIDRRVPASGRALSGVEAWAGWSGMSVAHEPDSRDSARCWVSAEFTYLAVPFKAYANVAADET